MTVLVHHRVPFRGRRTATAPATCAQRHMWNLIERQLPDAAFYNVCHWVELPGRGTAPDLLAVFTELLGRHESLRTGFQRAGDGGLVQQVVRTGECEAEVWTAGPGEDPTGVLDAWRHRMRRTPFEPARAPLIRFMAVVVGGAPVLAAFCVSHLAADLMSLRLLADEVLRLLDAAAAGRPFPPAALSRQPVEQAGFEHSPRGRALLHRAHAYWRRQIAGAPATLFPVPGAAGGEPAGRYSAAMDSRAVALAVPVLARHWRVSTSAVLLTVVALLLGRRAGLPSCTLRLLTANRSDPRLRGTVANLHAEVAATIDLDGERVEDIARRALAASTAAYANGLYDPDEVADLFEAVARERGAPVDLSYCFNDIRAGHGLPEAAGGPAPVVSGAALRTAMADTVVAPHEFTEGETFFLVIDDEEPGWMRLVLNADSRALAPPEVRGFLYDVERVLVEQAERAPADGHQAVPSRPPRFASGGRAVP
ncbi:condensation domain-containing protein [Streptomyces hygroscopicus]|uniref:condensation domain-containing protein n=1 Tax=Streptomyces hygroscopicus TaxID=1912 RepID=UPI0036320962